MFDKYEKNFLIELVSNHLLDIQTKQVTYGTEQDNQDAIETCEIILQKFKNIK